MNEPTDLEKRLYNDLSNALEWLQNIAGIIGDNALVDCLPNNWGGRMAIQNALANVERKYPDLARYPSGTFITDGCVTGLITGFGHLCNNIPAYRVDLGGGRISAIPCRNARQIA